MESLKLPPTRALAQLYANSGIKFVTFDITDLDHVEAAASLIRDRKQHPTLRFHLEPPFHNIHSMLSSKITNAFFDGVARPKAGKRLAARKAAKK